MSKIFDTNDVVVLKVDEDDLISFLLKMDIDDMGQALYPLELFTEELISVIPEYVFAEYETSNISQVQVVQKLREAAKSIYKIKEYDLMRKACLENDDNAKAELDNFPFRKKGEFGELLLHFLLRDSIAFFLNASVHSFLVNLLIAFFCLCNSSNFLLLLYFISWNIETIFALPMCRLYNSIVLYSIYFQAHTLLSRLF